MDPVMVPWITWWYRRNGILYWAWDYSTQTADPWLDPVTYPGDGDFADRIAGDLVVDVSAFSRNPAALFGARERMARRIEQLAGKRQRSQ